MKALFADTFYFLALVSPKDRAHAKAMAFSATYQGPILTTAWILMEVGDALCRVPDRPTFLTLFENLATDPNALVVPASQEAFDKARVLFAARPDKEWSLTDCTSFVTMEEAGLTQAITGDRHFEQAGYVALLK